VKIDVLVNINHKDTYFKTGVSKPAPADRLSYTQP